MAARPLSVAVHSARKLIGESLAMCLSTEPDLVVAGHTQEWAQLSDLCRLRRPEVIVLEIGQEVERETAGLRGLTQLWPALRVVVVSDQLSATWSAPAHVLFLPYTRGFASLVAVLQEMLARRAEVNGETRHARLTDRELDVLRLLSSGLTVCEVAKLLGIGPRGVENHKRRIYAKLGANSQSLAVSSVAMMGLLDVRPHPFVSTSDLSGRDRDLLRLASHGASMRQMANSLGVAPKTVESQLSRLYRKLGVHNRAAALAVAHAYGLVPADEAGESDQ